MMRVTAIIAVAACSLVQAVPVWDSADTETEGTPPVTINPWRGHARISGAFLLSRVNLQFLNETCSKYSSDLDVATQVVNVLAETELKGITKNQLNKYGFVLLKLETEYKNVLNYLTHLLLCDGRGSELWVKFYRFRDQATALWKLLRKAGVQRRDNTDGLTILTILPNRSVTDLEIASERPTTLLTHLFQERPRKGTRQQNRSPAIIGLGIGFLASYLFSSIFDNNNKHAIENINKNINVNNKLLRITNERIDMLATNVSLAFNAVKTVLDKLAVNQELADIHQTIIWNFDQLLASITDIRNTFKASEVTITMLEQGVLNPDLIDLDSFKATIEEGRKSFPTLDFPIEVSRYTLAHIVKILKLHRVSLHKFLMVIPLTSRKAYEVYSLFPHPIRMDVNHLVVPELRNVLLKSNDSYIIADKDSMYSVLPTNHILLKVEPIFSLSKSTCEFEAYKANTSAVLRLCNYKKATSDSGTFVTETEEHRLVYFSESTKVLIDCPRHQTRDALIGLHKLSLACDVRTDDVYYPAKQTVAIESLEINETLLLDSTPLPIINVNRTSKVHESLRALIRDIPVNDSFTIDFAYHGLQLDEVTTYSLFGQSALSLIVILNSIFIVFLFVKWWTHRNKTNSPHDPYLQDKFKRLRNSIRSFKNKNKESFRAKRQRQSFRESVKDRTDRIKQMIHSSPKIHNRFDSVSSLKVPTTINAGTNTDLNLNIANKLPEVYPTLPRYT